MGNLTHNVVGNPVAEFRSAARVPITSLKAHFTPTQEGSGDPSPSNVRAIQGWTGVDFYQDDVYLPVEYQRVEYLESTGTQYINTEYCPGINTSVDIKFRYTGNDTYDHNPFGSRKGVSNQDYSIWTNSNTGKGIAMHFPRNSGLTTDTSWVYTGDIKSNPVRVIVTPQTITVNDIIIYTFTGGRTEYVPECPAYAFAANSNDTGFVRDDNKYAIYWLKIMEGTTIHRDFIPCYRKSDNEPGMYDTVTNTFFTNQGTGSFTCGPARGQMIPVTFPVLGKNKVDIGTVSFTTYKQYTLSNPIPAGTYTISALVTSNDTVNNTCRVLFRGNTTGSMANLGHALLTRDSRASETLTFAQPVTEINLYASSTYAESSEYEATWTDVQLELGSTATAYEPYNANNTVYGGYVDLAKGEVVATYGIMHLNEISNWTGYASSGSKTRVYIDSGADVIASAAYATVPSVSNKFMPQGQSGYPEENKFCFSNTTKGRIFLGLSSSITSLEEFKTWFETIGGADFAYQLITPLHYPITPTQLTTLLDRNYIWSNSNGNTEVSYAIHDSAMVQNAKKRIAANNSKMMELYRSKFTYTADGSVHNTNIIVPTTNVSFLVDVSAQTDNNVNTALYIDTSLSDNVNRYLQIAFYSTYFYIDCGGERNYTTVSSLPKRLAVSVYSDGSFIKYFDTTKFTGSITTYNNLSNIGTLRGNSSQSNKGHKVECYIYRLKALSDAQLLDYVTNGTIP